MRRIKLVLAACAVMVSLLVAAAAPAMAIGPVGTPGPVGFDNCDFLFNNCGFNNGFFFNNNNFNNCDFNNNFFFDNNNCGFDNGFFFDNGINNGVFQAG